MLSNLTVKNLALFKDISVEFGEGLNVLTGETGAGKSILIGSCLLALGGRYRADMIRDGSKAGYVELTFDIDDESVRERLEALDDEIDLSDGILVISRRLTDGKSVSRINGETVTQKKLRRTASVLLDVYGQRDSQTLLEPVGQKSFLDAYAGDGLAEAKAGVREAYRTLVSVKKQIREIGEDDRERTREADLLSYEVQEIFDAGLREGEDEELESEYARLTNAQQIIEGMNLARAALAGTDGSSGASDMVARAVRELAGIRGYDEAAAAMYDQLVQIDELMSDASREISSYADGFEFSQADVDRIGSRLDQINRLKSKYGDTIGEITRTGEMKQQRLDLLTDAAGRLEELTRQREETEKTLLEKCALLSKGREKYARLMESEIAGCLSDLNFADNRFEIKVMPDGPVTDDGYDEVVFYIGPNPGEPVRELTKIASGGELSRIMLAVKAVMAGHEAGKTLIFDEIDAGISGRTAGAVARKLDMIARGHQVLCITHLAQIAAMADNHYRIEKSVSSQPGLTETVTLIEQLTDEGEIEELARILGGTTITEASFENAKEMKDLARDYKEKNTVRDI